MQADVLRIERRIRQDENITMLVNNAGIGPEGPLVDGNIDYLDRMILINVIGGEPAGGRGGVRIR